MAYGHYSRRYSYESPSPVEVSDTDIKTLFDTLKEQIENNKLKDIRSTLSKLKLSSNEKYKDYVGFNAVIIAYIHALKIGSNKAINSLEKTIFKKNFTFDGLNIISLSKILKNDFKLFIDQYLIHKNAIYTINDNETITFLFLNYPTETEIIIQNGKISKFIKGQDRLNVILSIIKYSKLFETIVTSLTTLYGIEYVDKFSIKYDTLKKIHDEIILKPKNLLKSLLNDFYYIIYREFITADILSYDLEHKLLLEITQKNYIDSILNISEKKLFELLYSIKDPVLRTNFIVSSEKVLSLIIKNGDNTLIPDEIKDIFLF